MRSGYHEEETRMVTMSSDVSHPCTSLLARYSQANPSTPPGYVHYHRST